MLERLLSAIATTGLFTATLIYNVDDPEWYYWAMLAGWFIFALFFGTGNRSGDAGGSDAGGGG